MTLRNPTTIFSSVAIVISASGCFDPEQPPVSGADTDASSTAGSSTDPTLDTTSVTISASATTTTTIGDTSGASSDDSASTSTSGPDESSSTGSCSGAGCPCTTEGDSEECDRGFRCDGRECVEIICGDGLVHGDEQCDDTNLDDGDGCDADCTFTEVVIDVSYRSTCALIEGGRVRCWGMNASGQLGYGNTDTIGDDELPYEVGDVQLPGPVIQLQSGDDFTCGRLASKTDVVCWGLNNVGQLGYGNTVTIGDDEFPSTLSPVSVGADVDFITTGGSHACVITAAGQVKCWGAGGAQLGYGNTDTIGDDELPSDVGNVQVGAAIVDLSGGIGQTCVITSGGGIRCWGPGFNGQLGYGNTDTIGDDETPDSVGVLAFDEDAIQISAGLDHTCALFEGGAVRCWGAAFNGQLGQGNTDALGDDEPATTIAPITVPLEGVAVAVAAGDSHNCVLDSLGQLACWGANSNGELGLGHTDIIGDDEPAQATMPIDFELPVRQLDAGGSHTCAVLEDYRVYCWGWNAQGQLGLGHTDNVGDDELPAEAGQVQLFAPGL